jgi:hypothetical protein
MPAWVSSIVVGILSLLGVALGWFVTHRQTRRLDAARRSERIIDVQTALRAEIRSHRRWLEPFDQEQETGRTVAKIIGGEATNFTPFVPREVENFVFDAVVSDIHILPGDVIDPVVLYYRQMHALARMAEDLRSERFDGLDAARKADMYQDYVAMAVYALDLADETIELLNKSLSRRSGA